MSNKKKIRKNMLILPEQPKEMPNVFVAITAHDGKIYTRLAEALIMWQYNDWYDFAVHFVDRHKPLDSARNLIVDRFLNNTQKEWTHLCFIDNDIAPKADTLGNLIKAEKDCISPLIFTLKDNPEQPGEICPIPLIFKEDEMGNLNVDTRATGIAETANVTGGMMLLSKELIETVEKPAFKYGFDGRGVTYKGTDQYFTELIHKEGYKAYVDTASDVDQITEIGCVIINNALIKCAETFSGRKYKEVAYLHEGEQYDGGSRGQN